jgi:hypothetical protein
MQLRAFGLAASPPPRLGVGVLADAADRQGLAVEQSQQAPCCRSRRWRSRACSKAPTARPSRRRPPVVRWGRRRGRSVVVDQGRA